MQPLAPGAVPFPLFVSGWVLPEEGPLPNVKGGAGLGCRVERVPLARVTFPSERAASAGDIAVATAAASYVCVKPAAAYKKIFAAAEATAAHAREVLHALAGDAAGEGASPNMEFKEVRPATSSAMLRHAACADCIFRQLLRRCARAWLA